MQRRLIGLAVTTALFASSATALQNGDFAEFDQPADGATIGYATGEGPPGWYITVSFDGGAVTYSDTDAADGRGYFSFNNIGPDPRPGFGDNKLEQCVPIDDDTGFTITYSALATEAAGDGDLRTRVNPNFYASREDCLLDIFEDAGDRRLSDDGRPNDDADYRFVEDDAGVWIDFSPDTISELRYTAEDVPTGSTYMLLSIRARNRSDNVPNAEVRFDNIRVVQEGSSENLVINGSFEHAELFDGSPIAGMDGWVISRGGDPLLRAAVGPQGFALSGDNVFYFEDLQGGFGDSRLDQCIPLDGEDIRPSVFVYTLTPDSGVSVRLNADFYAADDCSDDALGDLRLREDFDLDIDPASWTALITDEVRTAGQYADAGSALISIRVRDRSDSGGPSAFPQIVFLDDAASVSAIATPTFSPAPGEYVDSVEVTLSSATDDVVIYYTLDGTVPDDTAANVPSGGSVQITETSTLTARAFLDGRFSAARSGDYTITAPPPPPPPPPRELSTGCSVSDRPSPLDPTLWVLAALAAGGLLWRRRRDARQAMARD